MQTGVNHSLAPVLAAIRRAGSRWWGGIECRVAFIITLAMVLAAVLVSAALLWEGNRSRERELRGRADLLGRYYALLVREPLRTGDRNGLARIARTALGPRGDGNAGLRSLLVYDRSGTLVAAAPAGSPAPPARPAPKGRKQAGPPPPADGGVVELALPVMSGQERIGSIAIGVSAERSDQHSEALMTAMIVITGMPLLGLVFSRALAGGIVKPLGQLSAAVEELGTQNRIEPLPVHGTGEIARLASAFNQMAQTLKQRETSLSQGNRDLFLLHTAGLELMESLDLPLLLGKIAARAADLVKADTTAVSAIDRNTKVLAYLGVEGSRAQALRERELPFEAGGIYNWLVTYGTPLLIPDAENDFRLDGGLMASLGVRSLMTVPLWSSNRMTAILTVMNKQGEEAFDKHDLRLFTVFSSLAGAALQNAFLYADLKHKMDELHSTQRQLLHSTRLAAVGELATNLAHEINNPLTSVLGYTSHLLTTLDIPDDARHKLRLMEQETLRVRKIIRNLLDFSRQRAAWMRPGDLLQPLRETVALVQGVAERASVRIVENYPPAPVTVNMDPNELKQVFLNIMNNALHAMPDGGELTVGAAADQEGAIIVEIRDTGHGIAQEHLEKIFEPFFSTKSSRDGTGLGLSISQRIIQNHGGRIDVESEAGRGTVFRIILPAGERHTVRS